ncbi:MAG: hypothetical protein ACM3X7_11905 [Solirubrobacterales bacterium]
MKKIILLIIIAIIPIFNLTKVYADNRLNIDSESLNSNDAYISITDIYEIPLFTEKTIKQKEENEANKKSNLEKISNSIFQKSQLEDSSKDDKFKNQVEKYHLFIKPKEKTKIRYLEGQEGSMIIEASIIILLLCILTALLTRKYYKYKSKKEDESCEYKNYIRPEGI